MSRRRRNGGDDHKDESWRSSLDLGQPQFLTFLRESTKPACETWCSSIKRIIFSNVIENHTKTTVGMSQVKDHVYPDLARRVPTICFLVLFFKKQVNYFTVYILLMQDTTITFDQNMRKKKNWSIYFGVESFIYESRKREVKREFIIMIQ